MVEHPMPGGIAVKACINDGCEKIRSGHCTVYANPEAQWRTSRLCPFSNAVKVEYTDTKTQKKARVRAKKRSRKLMES